MKKTTNKFQKEIVNNKGFFVVAIKENEKISIFKFIIIQNNFYQK